MSNAMKYDISKNSACFLSYITKSIRYKSIKLKVKHKKLYNSEELSLNTTQEDQERINLIADEINNLEDTILLYRLKGFNEVFENKELIKSIENLTQKQKNIIYELYVNQITERELAVKLDTSFQNINKVKKTALKKLNKALVSTNIYLKN